jgi:membrane protein implicated in regulation of membrane protease activity
MIEFFNALSAVEKLYLACALIGGILLFLRTVTLLIGGGFEGEAEYEGDLDFEADVDLEGDFDFEGEVEDFDVEESLEPSDASFRIFTLQGLLGFFMMFGLIGLALTQQIGLGDFWSLLGALAAGILTMWLVSRLFIGVGRLQESGNIDYRNAVGAEGVVYLTIPPQDTGKIQVVIQGGLRICEAASRSQDPIKTGTQVRVVDVVNENVLVVEEKTDPGLRENWRK